MKPKLDKKEFDNLKKTLDKFLRVHGFSEFEIANIIKACNSHYRLDPIDSISWHDSSLGYAKCHFLCLKWMDYVLKNIYLYEHIIDRRQLEQRINSIVDYADNSTKDKYYRLKIERFRK